MALNGMHRAHSRGVDHCVRLDLIDGSVQEGSIIVDRLGCGTNDIVEVAFGDLTWPPEVSILCAKHILLPQRVLLTALMAYQPPESTKPNKLSGVSEENN